MTRAQFVDGEKKQIPRWLKPSRNDKGIRALAARVNSIPSRSFHLESKKTENFSRTAPGNSSRFDFPLKPKS